MSLLLAMVTTYANAEDIWTKDQANPVLTPSGDSERFDSTYIAAPRVVYDDATDTYFMYYTGCVEPNIVNKEMAGLATAPSLNGPWTRYDASGDRCSIFEAGKPGAYDQNRNWCEGTVIKEGPNNWKMWTVGDGGEGSTHIGRVGFATSTNGYDWTKFEGEEYGGSIFEDMSGVTSGARGILEFAVLKENDTYHAWYATFQPQNTIKYATSPDGIHWTPQKAVLSDVYGISNVVKIDQTYYLTTSKPDLTAGEFYTSTDRINWTKYDHVRLSPSAEGWDSEKVYYPFLLPTADKKWHVFYTSSDGATSNPNSSIGHAWAVPPAQITEMKSSVNFTYKYEFANGGPDSLDLDNNGNFDVTAFGNSPLVSAGVATLTTNRSEDSAYVNAGGLSSNLEQEIWRSVSFDSAEGFTVEFSVKVISLADGASGTTSLYVSPADEAGANADDTDGWLQIGPDGQHWGPRGFGFLNENDLGNNDNTDAFHVFRVALNPNDQSYTVWRDGVLLGSQLGDIVPGGDGLNRMILGDVSAADGGVIRIEYIRFTEGAFAPQTTSIPGDANGDGSVNAADAKILADNWQKTGNATWSDGDFTGDGNVDDADAALLAANWQQAVTASASVPEPIALELMFSGLLFWLIVR